jgi:hypothetical protein
MTVYCPRKKCYYNNAKTDRDEGVCTKDNLDLEIINYGYNDFSCCTEYIVISHRDTIPDRSYKEISEIGG